MCQFDDSCKLPNVRCVSFDYTDGGGGAMNSCELHLYDLKNKLEQKHGNRIVVKIICGYCDAWGCSYCVDGIETVSYWVNELKKLSPGLRSQILLAFKD